MSFPTRERGLKPLHREIRFIRFLSFPTRERGLKLETFQLFIGISFVVPYAGTWIETFMHGGGLTLAGVVPYAGTWIETLRKLDGKHGESVVPYAGTWIETYRKSKDIKSECVVPYAGTWIETYFMNHINAGTLCRSLRGNVD